MMAQGAPDEEGPGRAYLLWFYGTGVWKNLSYRGARILKNPLDLWNYQEIFQEHGIEWVVETGTRHGGSALYFADLLDARGSPGFVISVDTDHHDLQIAPSGTIRLIKGDSASLQVGAQVAGMLPQTRGPAFFILDADHAKGHVRKELELYVPMMRRGDYLVVEDTCVNGHPVRPDFGPGPMEAVEEFLAAHPSWLIADRAREQKFGCTFAPRGYFVRA